MSGTAATHVTSPFAGLSFAQVLPQLLPLLPDGPQTHHADLARLEAMWTELTATAHSLPDIVTAARFLITDPTQDYTPAHTATLLAGHNPLHDAYDALSAVTQWTPDILAAVIAKLIQNAAGSPAVITSPLRIALTAREDGPDLAKTMAVLGQNESLRRLKVALHHVHANGGHH